MANFLADLLSSGDYSDLTLVCEDREFRVHQTIVCAQSPVLAAAMKGGFKEANTNTFHVVDFDPITVKCMLDYLYTGKYELVLSSSCDVKKDQGQTTENDTNDSVNTKTRTWIYHGSVNCIADYFCLSGLAKMATAKLDKLIQAEWLGDAFCDLLYGTHGRTGDKDFRDMLATRAVDHINELMARGLFNGMDPPSDDMTPAVLRLCVQKLDSETARANTETARANKETARADEEAARAAEAARDRYGY